MKLASVWVAALAVVGCTKADSGTVTASERAPKGKERGDCIAPPKAEAGSAVDEFAVGTCDPGLLCLSNVCVRPPPADCQAIADQLTSFDLGNYAELEERAPVVDKYKRACNKAMVSKEQGECMAKATDKFSAFQCAPLMFPEMGKATQGGGGDCDKIMAIMRGYMNRSMGGTQDPNTTRMLDAVLTAMGDSCAQDGWPATFKQCILTAGDNTDAMNKCNSQMPPDVQQKLTERMTKVMQQQAQPQPAPTTPF